MKGEKKIMKGEIKTDTEKKMPLMNERKNWRRDKKEDEGKNWAVDAKKKSPGIEVNNWMDERKKSNMEKEKKDEVKN